MSESRKMSFAGVDGVGRIETKDNGLFRIQEFVSKVRNTYTEDAIKAIVRFDDRCGNHHNTFSITAEMRDAGGCLHDEVAKAFPELAPLIKWHQISTDGPLNYVENTTYLAGNRDCYGRVKGDPVRTTPAISFGPVPFRHEISKELRDFLKDAKLPLKYEAVEHPEDPETYSTRFKPFGFEPCRWHSTPWDCRDQAEDFCNAFNHFEHEFTEIVLHESKGKKRELDLARAAAIWPEATDEQLCLPKEELAKLLEERLPGLIEQFRSDIEKAGFVWEL